MNTMQRIADEAGKAKSRYGMFASTHEAYGVLAEEVAELLDAIRSNHFDQIEFEAVQVAAVAARLAQQCANIDESGVFAERSVK